MDNVFPIKAFTDNYIWALPEGNALTVVDPGDAAPVLELLRARRLRLSAILLTHHHGDHTHGVHALTEAYRVPVYGPAAEAIAGVTHPLADGDTIELANPRIRFRVIGIPGHTRGHIAYAGNGVLFCGDTLFAGGCGRLFEGTAAQMYQSLSRLMELPPNTHIYCGHEYTEANLRFACRVEPGNAALRARLAEVQAMRARGEPTLPSTLALERSTNPFLRVDQASVIENAETHAGKRLVSPEEVFAAVRAWKDKAA